LKVSFDISKDGLKWFAIRSAVVGAVLSPFFYYSMTNKMSFEESLIFTAVELIVAASTSFTVLMLELWYKTRKMTGLSTA
jgi:hypothetical protein